MCGAFSAKLSPDDMGNLCDTTQPALQLELPVRYNGASAQDKTACRAACRTRRLSLRV